MSGPLVLCPLEHERRIVKRRVASRAEIITSGPGPGALSRCVETILTRRPSCVILCGLAGGLAPTDPVPRIAKIIDADGKQWQPSVQPKHPCGGITLIGVDRPVTTAISKRDLARKTDAALVDCESHVFARLMESTGLRWGVVRGVSDGPDDELPSGVDRWIDGRGRTRGLYVVGQLTMRPALAPIALSLARRSSRVLEMVARRVVEILDAEERPS